MGDLVVHGALVLDLGTGEACVRGRSARLTPTEAAALVAIVRHGPLGDQALAERISDVAGPAAARVHVQAIRRKLGAGVVQRRRGVGYWAGV
jgi:DNA-binding response OmpR family regulator